MRSMVGGFLSIIVCLSSWSSQACHFPETVVVLGDPVTVRDVAVGDPVFFAIHSGTLDIDLNDEQLRELKSLKIMEHLTNAPLIHKTGQELIDEIKRKEKGDKATNMIAVTVDKEKFRGDQEKTYLLRFRDEKGNKYRASLVVNPKLKNQKEWQEYYRAIGAMPNGPCGQKAQIERKK